MAEWVHYFNFAVASGGFAAALLGFGIALLAPYMQRWERRYFCVIFALLTAYIASDLVERVSLTFLGADFLWLARAGVFLELLLSVAILPLFTGYLVRCAGDDWRRSFLFQGAVALFGVYIVVLIAAQFGDAVYLFSVEDKCVLAGPFYPALIIPPILLLVINLVGFIRKRAALTRFKRIAYAICTVVPLACVFVQAVLFGLSVLVFGISASAFTMLVLVLIDQAEAHIRQIEESAQRQAQIMALQMRPHFIYNVMTSIYQLCAQNPARAQQVTLDFTDYLRANFDAVAQEGQVPFSKELDHARAYLNVEQARLERDLVVDIDCPHTDFCLPPLTLQPLVENAVKHGAGPELPPLYVRITTYEEAGYSVVTVEDTGPGFEMPPLVGDFASEAVDHGSDDRASDLDNIRDRLAACSSTLEIASRRGGGTVAIVRVPSREQGE